MNVNIRKADALELLQSLDDKSVDLILTDPPYYKFLNVDWDKQWKTKEDYLIWLEPIVKECKRVLKDNGSFYMFCSPAMLIKVGGVVDKYFNILNTIRWVNTGSMSFRSKREELRRYLNPSEEIIFAEQFIANDDMSSLYEPIRKYLDDTRKRHNLTVNQIKQILGVSIKSGDHYFSKSQWELPTEPKYNKLKQHMDLKPYEEILKQYEEIKAEYEALRRTFKLTSDKPYNNTWSFKQTPARKGRHPCEKPEDLISHIIDVSSNENDLVVDPFCGSCVVPKCCDKMNRRCIAGDLDDTYLDLR